MREEARKIENIVSKLMIGCAVKFCTVALFVAKIAPFCCRGNWYQPEEPECLQVFLLKKKFNRREC